MIGDLIVNGAGDQVFSVLLILLTQIEAKMLVIGKIDMVLEFIRCKVGKDGNHDQ